MTYFNLVDWSTSVSGIFLADFASGQRGSMVAFGLPGNPISKHVWDLHGLTETFLEFLGAPIFLQKLGMTFLQLRKLMVKELECLPFSLQFLVRTFNFILSSLELNMHVVQLILALIIYTAHL
jgi:hypothetical protein